MRSLSLRSDIRSFTALPFLRTEPQSLPSPGPEAVGGPCARRFGKKKTKKKDSIALALSFVFTVIYAGPFIRCATKEARAAWSLFVAVDFLFIYNVLYFQMSSLVSAVTFIVLSKMRRSKSARYLVPSLYVISSTLPYGLVLGNLSDGLLRTLEMKALLILSLLWITVLSGNTLKIVPWRAI